MVNRSGWLCQPPRALVVISDELVVALGPPLNPVPSSLTTAGSSDISRTSMTINLKRPRMMGTPLKKNFSSANSAD